MTNVIQISNDIETIMQEILQLNKLQAESIFVLGCSSSEIIGSHIGKNSSAEIGFIVVQTILKQLAKHNIFLAIQCCEHLNRCLVIEKTCMQKYNLTEVNVLPVLKAGGSVATAGMQLLSDAVVVENIQASAGMDIGDTFIGMHLKSVVVPFRATIKTIGQAHVTCAYTRAKLVGGARAVYQKE